MYGAHVGKMGLSLQQTMLIRALAILRRFDGNTTDFHLSSVTTTTATSTGAITIADGGYVQVLDGKTWRIT